MTQIVPIRGRYGTRPKRPRLPALPTGTARPPISSGATPPAPRPPSVASAAAAPVAPGLPAPVNPADPGMIATAQQQTQAQIDPMLQYLTNKYGGQMTGVSNAISGLTGQRASFLGSIAGKVGQGYAQAISPVSAAAGTVNAQLNHVGAQNKASETQAMAAAGLPTNSAGPDVNPGALAAQGAGAAGAAGAIGQALIDSLTAAQSAAMKYAEQLPSFAQAEGAYQTRTTLMQISAQLADQLAQTTAQAPTIFWNIYNNLLDRAQNDRNFAQQVQEYNDSKARDQRDYNFRVKQYNAQVAARRAGIVAPNAPTNAGRQGYWQTQADRRTQSTGYQWVATTTGVRPVDADPKTPGIQKSWTLQGKAANALGLERTASAKATTTRATVAQTNATTAQQRAAETARHNKAAENQAAQKEAARHAEAQRKIAIAQQNAKTSAAKAAVAKRAQAEKERHDKATEAIARAKKAAGKTPATRRAWNVP